MAADSYALLALLLAALGLILGQSSGGLSDEDVEKLTREVVEQTMRKPERAVPPERPEARSGPPPRRPSADKKPRRRPPKTHGKTKGKRRR
jgi:hypothetical protein